MDDQLADEIHQLVEPGDVDANRLLGQLELIAAGRCARDPLGLRDRDGVAGTEHLDTGRALGLLRPRCRRGRVAVGIRDRLPWSVGRRGNHLHAHDFLDRREARANLEEFERAAPNQHGQERGPELAFDLLAIRSRGDENAHLLAFDDQLQEPDGLPLAQRVDLADDE